MQCRQSLALNFSSDAHGARTKRQFRTTSTNQGEYAIRSTKYISPDESRNVRLFLQVRSYFYISRARVCLVETFDN